MGRSSGSGSSGSGISGTAVTTSGVSAGEAGAAAWAGSVSTGLGSAGDTTVSAGGGAGAGSATPGGSSVATWVAWAPDEAVWGCAGGVGSAMTGSVGMGTGDLVRAAGAILVVVVEHDLGLPWSSCLSRVFVPAPDPHQVGLPKRRRTAPILACLSPEVKS